MAQSTVVILTNKLLHNLPLIYLYYHLKIYFFREIIDLWQDLRSYKFDLQWIILNISEEIILC